MSYFEKVKKSLTFIANHCALKLGENQFSNGIELPYDFYIHKKCFVSFLAIDFRSYFRFLGKFLERSLQIVKTNFSYGDYRRLRICTCKWAALHSSPPKNMWLYLWETNFDGFEPLDLI